MCKMCHVSHRYLERFLSYPGKPIGFWIQRYCDCGLPFRRHISSVNDCWLTKYFARSLTLSNWTLFTYRRIVMKKVLILMRHIVITIYVRDFTRPVGSRKNFPSSEHETLWSSMLCSSISLYFNMLLFTVLNIFQKQWRELDPAVMTAASRRRRQRARYRLRRSHWRVENIPRNRVYLIRKG